MDWTPWQQGLAHPDNDKRINALHQLRDALSEATSLSDPDSLATLLRQSTKSNNAHVYSAALNCLPAFFPLLVPPDSSASSPAAQAHSLKHAFALLLPFDKLGDAKAQTRELAREGIVSAARTSLRLGVNAGAGTGKDKEGPWQLLERGMHDFAFASKSAKAREQALHFLAAVRCPPPDVAIPLPPLRPFTPLLLPLLSDSDSTVRTLALHTTIAVFTHPSVNAAAKADLKKAMVKLDVSKKVQDQILGAVLGGAGASTSGALERSPSQASLSSLGGKSDSTRSAGSAQLPPAVPAVPDGPARRTRSQQAAASTTSSSTAAHTPSLLASLPAAAFPSDPSAVHAPSSSDLAPVYVASERDLRADFDAMKPGFEGKETEHNWQVRDRSIATIRGMILGGVARGELQAAFVKATKEVAEGIARISSSLRTTLAISTLTLISELATSLPPSSVDLFLDPFLPHLLSMAGQTKKIVASASQASVTALLEHSTFHPRTLHLVVSAQGEKTPSARQFAATHLATLVRVHGSDPRLEQADELEPALRRALVDPNAGVREAARKAYWEMVRQGQGMAARAERAASGLDAGARKLLEKAKPVVAASSAAEPAPVAAAPAPARELPKRTTARAAAAATGPAAGGAGAAKRMTMKEMMAEARRKKLEAEANGTGAQDELLPESEAAPVQASASPVASPARSTPTATPRKGLLSPAAAPSPARSPLSPPRPLDDDDAGSIEEEQATPDTPTFNQQDIMHSPSPFRLRSPLPSASPSAAATAPSPAGSPLTTPSRARPAPTPMRSAPSQSSLASSTTASSFSRSPRASKRESLLPEPVVDDALREQAMQAEQAAQRLLELAEDEEDGAAPPRAETPKPNRLIPAGLPAGGVAGAVDGDEAMRTPLMNPAKRRLAGMGGKMFEDSPDARRGSPQGKGSWWVRKADNLPPPPPLAPDSPTRTAEITSLISSLQSLSIDAPSLRKLSALSKERPVREVEDEDDEGAANGVGERTTASFWGEERRFEKVYEGLRAFLLQPGRGETGMTRDVALLLLKDLVENQFPCFAGDEGGLLDLLLKLREDPSRTSLAATESLSTLIASNLEPLYGLGALTPSLTSYLSTSTAAPDVKARSYALGLKMMGGFFERLPGEVLEDVLPGAKDLLKKALDDPSSGDLRRAAITALVSAQSVLHDEQRLTELVGGLARDQANLLAYYCAKRGV
ncbi:hypothetical protein JCM10207_006728 [Rhodosporidiobolus poonsookiae]